MLYLELTLATIVMTVANAGVMPPNIDQVRHGVNVLLGRTPHEQRADLVGQPLFTLSGNKGDVGSWIYYSQFRDMSTAEDCQWQGVSNTVSFSTSAATLEAQSESSSNGFDQQTSIGASIPLGPAEVSAETTIRNALIFGNSRTSAKQYSERQAGMTYTYDATARRTLYSVEVDWSNFAADWWTDELKQACTNLGSNPSDAAVVAFFDDIGTHGLAKASLGQTCTSSVFMESGETMTAYYQHNEKTRSNTVGFLWWTSTSSSTQSDTSATDSTYGFSYAYANKHCIGEIGTASSCGESMRGTTNSPAIVKWTYTPIWTMNIPTLSSGAKTRMLAVFNSMMQASVNCRRNSCNNHGSCAPNDAAWSYIGSTINYDSFFDGNVCYCDDAYIGNTCNEGRGINVGSIQKPTGWQNDYDGALTVTGMVNSQESPFCGVESQHNNDNEDRQFKFSPCKIAESTYATTWGSRQVLITTNYDEHWLRECSGDRVMTYVNAWHSNDHEDRQFVFQCRAFKYVVTKNCEWSTNWINNWDAYFDFKCAAGKVITGIESYHDNNYEDRRFKFKCCELQADRTEYYSITQDSAWSAYKNTFDNRLVVTAASNRAFCGVSSYHDNDYEDRRYRFKECSSSNGAITSGSMWYSGWSTYDAALNLVCPDNKVLRYIDSYHDNYTEDRKFKIGCQDFVGGSTDMCFWTPYVNNLDAAFDFACPSQYVMKGINSYHDNGAEDRRWKYYCCRWKFVV